MGKNCVYQVLVTKSPSIRGLVVRDRTLTANDRCDDPEADHHYKSMSPCNSEKAELQTYWRHQRTTDARYH